MTRVFVYGTLKRGHGNHLLLCASRFLGECHTPPVYSLHDLGFFPGLVSGGQTSITGEVYEVNDDTLEALDVLEGYPRFYDRELIDTPYGAAWVYVYLGSVEEHPVIDEW